MHQFHAKQNVVLPSTETIAYTVGTEDSAPWTISTSMQVNDPYVSISGDIDETFEPLLLLVVAQ